MLDPDGEMISERLRVETPYPCPPPVLLDELDKLAKTQPEYDRVSVGFPGAIRRGRVREVPAFSRRGPGLKPDARARRGVERLRARRRPAAALRPAHPRRERRRRAGLRGRHRHRHGAGDHPRDRRGLRGVLRRHPAAAHGALARPLRRGPVDRGRVRRPPPREDRQQGVAQARRRARSTPSRRWCCPTTSSSAAATPSASTPTPSARTARVVPNISGLLGGIKLWERAVGATALGEVPTPAKS